MEIIQSIVPILSGEFNVKAPSVAQNMVKNIIQECATYDKRAPYQRDLRWNVEMKRNLISSILNGIYRNYPPSC